VRITSVEGLVVRFDRGDSFGGLGSDGPASAARSQYSKQPGWRGIYSDRAESCLVRIATDGGLVGWGEAQAPIAPAATAAIVNDLLSQMLLGEDPLAGAVLTHEMYQSMNLRGHSAGFMLDAIAGADCALWDVRGKHFGVPVARLLGGPFRRELPAYLSGVRGADTAAKQRTIAEFRARGFTGFKYFGGFGVESDVEVCRALVEVLDGGWLAVDNLWNYDINEALRLGRALQGLGVSWYEAPTDPEDIAGNALLAQSLDMPVANGETERSRYQILPWLQARALDIVQPDIGRCGISEGRAILALAEAFHVPGTLHMGVCCAPLLAASLQVAAATVNVRWVEYQPVMLELANAVLKTPLQFRDGCLLLPEGPGLGIEIDEAKLEPLLTRPEARA
jgi:galactonate dehydratase